MILCRCHPTIKDLMLGVVVGFIPDSSRGILLQQISRQFFDITVVLISSLDFTSI